MIGRTVGHYEIVDKIGEGGMGVVFKARDTRLDRLVAVKFLAAGAVADARRKQRFVREAKAASALNHPNIVTIHEIASEGGSDFMVMEYVPGKTLARLISRKEMPLRDVLHYAVQIAGALAAAHDAGIVHRDLKPANIMVSDDRLVKVLDFGVAKLLEHESVEDPLVTTLTIATQEGMIVGTAAYMSPEQAEGRILDGRSDIFSFGSLLYEMVTGRRPFRGDSHVSTLAAVLQNEPEPLGSGVPRDLERVITRCLRKSPERRFQYMKDVRIELEELQQALDSGELAAAHESSARPRLSGFRWKAVAALVVAAVAGSIWWSMRSGKPREAGVPEGILTRLTADSGLTAWPALSPDGRLVAYASDRDSGGSLDLWVQQTAGGQPIRLTTDEADEYEPAFSPDGSRIAFRSEHGGGGIYVISALGGDARLLAQGGRSPRFSPDGNWLVYWVGSPHSAFGEIYIIGSRGGNPRLLHPRGRSPIWSPDGTRVLFYLLDGGPDWRTISAAGGQPVKTGAFEVFHGLGLAGDPDIISGPFLADMWTSKDSTVIFSARQGDSTSLWEAQISAQTWRLSGPPRRLTFGSGMERQASVAPDGSLVFSSAVQNEDIWMLPIDANRGKTTGLAERLTTSATGDTHPSVSADGRKIVFVSRQSGNLDVWMKDLESGRLRAVTETPEDEATPVVNADGSAVAFAAGAERSSRAIYVAPLPSGVPKKICENCGEVFDWSADGKRMLAGKFDYARRWYDHVLLDVQAGQARAVLRGGFPVTDPRFSPDGHWVAFHSLPLEALRRIFIARVTDDGTAETEEWIAVTGGSANDFKAAWSPDGNTLYFGSERDGFRCLYAQRLDPQTKQPAGSPLKVHDLHLARHAMPPNPGGVGVAVATDKIVFTIRETTGNIWVLKRPPAR